MKEIALSKQGKNKGKYVALVDDEDFEYLSQFRWHVDKMGKGFYAFRNIRVAGKRQRISMHWEVLNSKWIDHIDHDGLNNQKSNLRFCTRQENNMNRRKSENKSSIYKGVCLLKPTNKWMAYITINHKRNYLGLFTSETEAAKTYNAKAAEIFGKYANLNELN